MKSNENLYNEWISLVIDSKIQYMRESAGDNDIFTGWCNSNSWEMDFEVDNTSVKINYGGYDDEPEATGSVYITGTLTIYDREGNENQVDFKRRVKA